MIKLVLFVAVGIGIGVAVASVLGHPSSTGAWLGAGIDVAAVL